MNIASRRMIGSGIPISQSSAPFPNDMLASMAVFEITVNVDRFPKFRTFRDVVMGLEITARRRANSCKHGHLC